MVVTKQKTTVDSSVQFSSVAQSCLTLCDTMEYSPQTPLSSQESWSGLPCPTPGDLPNPGIEPRSPTLQADSLPSEPSVQFSSVTQSCPTLCDPMNCSTPGLPVYHQLPEFTQIHVHWVGDAIQPSHPLPSPSPPAFNLSQHQGLFQGVISHQVVKVLEFQFQD